ncbi:hypothetical protein HK099_002281 [Clydaea vesicula]|uniref:Pentatricopeptide repeat-containing protein n=1 Tax=Clydaea vesicula TaxID=447962 RepID=A0AAD5XWV4_9FUNG|nr:hypothetical protein HK099_002281 [Clydaea vesicula]
MKKVLINSTKNKQILNSLKTTNKRIISISRSFSNASLIKKNQQSTSAANNFQNLGEMKKNNAIASDPGANEILGSENVNILMSDGQFSNLMEEVKYTKKIETTVTTRTVDTLETPHKLETHETTKTLEATETKQTIERSFSEKEKFINCSTIENQQVESSSNIDKIDPNLQKATKQLKDFIEFETKKKNIKLLVNIVSHLEKKPDNLIKTLEIDDFIKILNVYFEHPVVATISANEVIIFFAKFLHLVEKINWLPYKLLFTIFKEISEKVERFHTIIEQYKRYDLFVKHARRNKTLEENKLDLVDLPLSESWEQKAIPLIEGLRGVLPYYFKDGFLKNEPFLKELFGTFYFLKDLEGLMKFEKEFRRCGLAIPVELYVTAIRLSGEVGDYDSTKRLFSTSVAQLHSPIPMAIYTSFVRALANLEMEENALSFINNDMVADKVKASILVYENYLDGLLKSGKNYDHALVLFEDLHFESTLPKPRLQTYLVMLDGALSNDDSETVQKILTKVNNNDISHQLQHRLFFHFVSRRMTQKAIEIIHILKKKSSNANIMALGVLIEILLEEGNTTVALNIFKNEVHPLKHDKILFVLEHLLEFLHSEGGNISDIIQFSKSYWEVKDFKKLTPKIANTVLDAFLSQIEHKPLTLEEYHFLLVCCIFTKHEVLRKVSKIVDLMQVKPTLKTFEVVNSYFIASKDNVSTSAWRAKMREAGVFEIESGTSASGNFPESRIPSSDSRSPAVLEQLARDKSELIKELVQSHKRTEAFALEYTCKKNNIPISFVAKLRLLEATTIEKNFGDTEARIKAEMNIINEIESRSPVQAKNLKTELLNTACRSYCLADEFDIAKKLFKKIPKGKVQIFTIEPFLRKFEKLEDKEFSYFLIEAWKFLNKKTFRPLHLKIFEVWFSFLKNGDNFDLEECLKVFKHLKTVKQRIDSHDYLMVLRCMTECNKKEMTASQRSDLEDSIQEIFLECDDLNLLTIRHFNTIFKYYFELQDYPNLYKFYFILKEKLKLQPNARNNVNFNSESLAYAVHTLVNFKKGENETHRGYIEALELVKQYFRSGTSKHHLEPILEASLEINKEEEKIKKGDLKVAEEVINLMQQKKVLEPQHIASFLTKLFENNNFEMATDIYNNLLNNYNLKRDTIIENVMINGYLNMDNYKAAKTIYDDMTTTSLESNENVHPVLFSRYKPKKNLETFQLFINFFRNKKVANDKVGVNNETLNTLLDEFLTSAKQNGFDLA